MALLRFDNAYLEGSADFQIIDDTLAVITDPFWRDELANRRLFVTSISSGPRETVEAVSTSRTQRPDPASRAAILHASIRMGRLDEAIEELTPPPGTRAVPAADDQWHQWLLFGDHALALVYAGRLVEADELLAMAYGELMDHPAAEARGLSPTGPLVLHLEQGRPLSAFRRAGESYSLFQQLGGMSLAPRGYMYAAHALALTGRAERRPRHWPPSTPLDIPILPIEGADLLQARAWVAAATGDLPGARARLEEAADLAEEIGHLVGAASALHDMARLGSRPPDGRPLGEPRHPGRRRVRSRPRRLCQRGGGQRRRGSPRGLRSLREFGRHPLRGRGERRGRRRAATAADVPATRAPTSTGLRQLLGRCEGAVTPVVDTIAPSARLTPGELDAAVQAAAGRSNKQIAADGHISVRTVESHLQRGRRKCRDSESSGSGRRTAELNPALTRSPADPAGGSDLVVAHLYRLPVSQVGGPRAADVATTDDQFLGLWFDANGA